MNDNNELEIISRKLSVLISLSLFNQEKMKTAKDKIEYLNKFSLTNIEIAQIINTSKNVVEVNLTNLKKNKKV